MYMVIVKVKLTMCTYCIWSKKEYIFFTKRENSFCALCVGASEYEAAELKGVVRVLHIKASSRSYTNHPLVENIYNFLLL